MVYLTTIFERHVIQYNRHGLAQASYG